MKERMQFYRPAVAAFLTMMAMALTSSTLSFFLEPVCQALEINRGSFSVVFSLLAVSGAITNPFLGQYAGKRGVRGILILSGIWVFGSMVLFAAAKQVWILYLAGFCLGAFSTNCAAFCASVMVQQGYEAEKAAGIQGIVMAGSGVGGMLFSVLIPGCMGRFGWRAGACAVGVSWLVLHLAAAVLLGKTEKSRSGSTGSAAGLGMTRKEAVRSHKLYLIMAVGIILTACCGIQQQLPALLADYGFETGAVSMMISFMTGTLAMGKIAQGFLCGRLGVKAGGSIMLGVFALGFLLMLHKSLVYPALVLLSFGLGIYTTTIPLVVRKIFGSREYAEIWALVSTVGSVGTFAANPVWGTIYDLTGSYALGQLASPVCLAAAIWALAVALGKKQA